MNLLKSLFLVLFITGFTVGCGGSSDSTNSLGINLDGNYKLNPNETIWNTSTTGYEYSFLEISGTSFKATLIHGTNNNSGSEEILDEIIVASISNIQENDLTLTNNSGSFNCAYSLVNDKLIINFPNGEREVWDVVNTIENLNGSTWFASDGILGDITMSLIQNEMELSGSLGYHGDIIAGGTFDNYISFTTDENMSFWGIINDQYLNLYWSNFNGQLSGSIIFSKGGIAITGPEAITDASSSTSVDSVFFNIVVTNQNGVPLNDVDIWITYPWAVPNPANRVQLYDGDIPKDTPMSVKTDSNGTYILRMDYVRGGGVEYTGTIQVTSGSVAGLADFSVSS